MKEVSKEFILKVLDLTSFDSCDSIWWRTDDDSKFGGEDFSPITFFVRCNDLFYWAVSDLEELTPENINEFEKAFEDIREIYKDKDKKEMHCATLDAPLLFCARQRKMRPQGAYYQTLPLDIWPLFDACGPEREVDAMNTPKPTIEQMKELKGV
jgi:hypothetical protein